MDSTCVTSPTRAVCKLQISGTGRCHVSSPASATSCHRGCCLGLYEFNRDTCREAVFFTELYNIRNMNTHTHTLIYKQYSVQTILQFCLNTFSLILKFEQFLWTYCTRLHFSKHTSIRLYLCSTLHTNKIK